MKHLRGEKLQELATLTGVAAFLVLAGLAISPGGGDSLARALSLPAVAPQSQTAAVAVWVSVSANPNPISEGQSTTISWWSFNADRCLLSGTGVQPNWVNAFGAPINMQPPAGSYFIPSLSEGTHRYTVYCYNSGYWNQGSSWGYRDVVVGPPPGVACQSGPNVCGMRGDGQAVRGVCNAVTPPDSACPACNSPANACGQTNAGIVINGVCTASTPSNDGCPACSSPPNACGMTRQGQVLNGACNATTPPITDCPACSSPPNECGQRNTGYVIGGSCNATAPTNASCPPPSIPSGGGGFNAQPNIVQGNQTALLTWNVTNATACTLGSDSSAFPSRAVGLSGSLNTNTITQTTTFTLSCQNGEGGPRASRSVRVVLTPEFQEI